MTSETVVADMVTASTFDERWTAWVARGVKQDRKARKRALAAAGVLGGGVVLWLVIVMLG